MFERVIDALFPPQCAGCGALGSGLCDGCAPRDKPVTVALETLRVRALGSYDGGLRRAILALKDGAATSRNRWANALPRSSRPGR